jgi:hypothetical protein
MKLVKIPPMTSIPLMLVEVQSIIDKILVSTWFPGTAPLTTAAQTALANLDTGAALAKKGSPASTAAMYVLADLVRIKTLALVLMVEGVAINNIPNSSAIIASAGLETKKSGAKNIQVIAVKAGVADGSVIVRCKAHKGFSYKIQMQKGGTDPLLWLDVTTTTITKIPVGGLMSETRYWFRVALIKGLSQGAYSNPVGFTVA